jgi:hypothetical protein
MEMRESKPNQPSGKAGGQKTGANQDVHLGAETSTGGLAKTQRRRGSGSGVDRQAA